MTTFDTASRPAERRGGRHPVNVGHLVMGIAFVGIVVVWILIEAEAVTGDEIRWLLPVPWVLAGFGGLLATTRRRRDSEEWRGAAHAAAERGWVGREEAAPGEEPPMAYPPLDDLDEKLARAERETSVRQASADATEAVVATGQDGRMTLPAFDGLASLPAVEHLDLVAPPVATVLRDWARAHEVAVCEIDPGLADTAALAAAYDLPLRASANCVLVAGSRGGEERIAACVVGADTRADVNSAVRKLLDVRKCSFLPMDRAVEESGMEYGGITPIGLPAHWRLLVDAAVVSVPTVMIGSGLRRSKIILPGSALADIAGAEVVEGLGRPIT